MMPTQSLSKPENNTLLYLSAIFFSVVLSIWVPLAHHVINRDGMLYIQTATVFNNHGLKAAINVYDWPFYSILIAYLHKFSPLSYETAAYTLNGIFSLISVFAFLQIIKQVGGNKTILWCALIVILLAHDFTGVRQYIIRGHGYWAFYLVSILLLLKFFESWKLSHAVLWSLSLIIASLFRIEGVFFLIIMPFSVFVVFKLSWRERLMAFLKLNFLGILALIVFLIGVFCMPHYGQWALGRIPRFIDRVSLFFLSMQTYINDRVNAMQKYIMPVYSKDDAEMLLNMVVFPWYIIKLVDSVTLIYSLLIIYGVYNRILKFSKEITVILACYFIVNFFMTGLFIFSRFYLTKRYVIGASLICIILVPFVLAHIYQQWKKYRSEIRLHKCLFPIVCLLIIEMSLGGIFNFGYSKAYMYNSGVWIAENINKNAEVFSNDKQVLYYTGKYPEKIMQMGYAFEKLNLLKNNNWKQFDYIVLRMDKHPSPKMQDILTWVPMKALKKFSNKRGDQVVIYKVNHQIKKASAKTLVLKEG